MDHKEKAENPQRGPIFIRTTHKIVSKLSRSPDRFIGLEDEGSETGGVGLWRGNMAGIKTIKSALLSVL